MNKQNYIEKLKDPRWQKIRLQVFERDGWKCQNCDSKDNTLCVHHKYYIKNAEPWEYPLEALATLCLDCHEEETSTRPYIEESLLSTFKGLFLSGELIDINIAFHEMPLLSTPENLATVIQWAITTPAILQELINRHSEILHTKEQ